MVAELLMYFDESVELTRSDATALYAGIVVDTKSFTVQAGVRTFEAASFLRRAGADPPSHGARLAQDEGVRRQAAAPAQELCGALLLRQLGL